MGLFSLSDLEYMFWAAIRNGSIGTIGAKGDPGGFTFGTDLGTSDLDTIVVSGLYRQTNGSYVTTASNYPLQWSTPLVLKVVTATADNARVLQELTYITGTVNAGSRSIWQRTHYAGVWGPWRAFNSSRVDQTAGRAIYQWDELNGREQIIYGDTGWRDLTPANGWTAPGGGIRIRRVGSMVTLAAAQLDGTAATADGFVDAMLLGFRASGFPLSSRTPVFTGNTIDTTRCSVVDITTHFPRIVGAYATLTGGNTTLTYPTNDSWPTVLPGVAAGSIPNL